MVNVEQLKSSVNRMSVEVIREAVAELRLDGLVTEGKTPFNKLHFNTCFAEIEALFQRAGYHRSLVIRGCCTHFMTRVAGRRSTCCAGSRSTPRRRRYRREDSALGSLAPLLDNAALHSR
ncbi:hypothetical protein D3C84_801990 [compost metagenome]